MAKKKIDEQKNQEDQQMENSNIFLGRGLDVGTMWLATAKKESDGTYSFKKIRDVFLDLEMDKTIKQMLKLGNASYIEKNDHIILVGDRAIDYANLFNREVRRPLSQGVISAGEVDAQEILTIMLKELLGTPLTEKEVVHYSVPAVPIDKNQEIIYHEMVFKKIIDSLGYKAIPMNEAAAIAYSNAADSSFSAVTISFGAGMCNICVMFQAINGLEFSIARGGDWIDELSAKAIGSTASKLAMIKETGIDLRDASIGDPKFQREREAIIFHYRALIKYALDNIAKQFQKKAAGFNVPIPIPLIIGGGTSLANGFLDVFKETFNELSNFPINISEIRHAENPLFAVSEGLLVASLNYEDEE